MKIRHSQQGLSSIGWLLVILVAGFFLTCAFKLLPVYADNIYVKDGLKSLEEFENTERGYGGMSNRDIESHLSKYFNINNVRSEAVDSVDIDRRSDKILVNMNYEVRVPMFYNVDAVVSFKNQFDTNRPAECCEPSSE